MKGYDVMSCKTGKLPIILSCRSRGMRVLIGWNDAFRQLHLACHSQDSRVLIGWDDAFKQLYWRVFHVVRGFWLIEITPSNNYIGVSFTWYADFDWLKWRIQTITLECLLCGGTRVLIGKNDAFRQLNWSVLRGSTRLWFVEQSHWRVVHNIRGFWLVEMTHSNSYIGMSCTWYVGFDWLEWHIQTTTLKYHISLFLNNSRLIS